MLEAPLIGGEAEFDELARRLHEALAAREKQSEITSLAAEAATKATELAKIKAQAIAAIERNQFEQVENILKLAHVQLEAELGMVNHLIRLVWSDLFSIAKLTVESDDDAKDVAQSAASRIFDSIAQFDAKRSQFRTWYYRVTINEAHAFKRSSSRWTRRLFSFLFGQSEAGPDQPSAMVPLVDAMLDRLSEDCRTRLRMVKPRGQKVGGMKDIAKHLGQEYEASRKATAKCVALAKAILASLINQETVADS